jgi:GNAT superfamily N-acetyltransferase
MNIRKAELSELGEIIAVAVAAFHNTPLYRYIAPDTGERELFLRVFFDTRFRNGFNTNVMEAAHAAAEEGGRILGVANWAPPAQTPDNSPVDPAAQAEITKKRRERFRETLAGAGVGVQILDRWAELMQTLSASTAKNPQGPHWQLAPVFIHPACQGKGIGSALMRKQFAVIDEAKLPITLTTQEANNVELYGHYGFAVTSETPIGNSGMSSYGMCRLPGAVQRPQA